MGKDGDPDLTAPLGAVWSGSALFAADILKGPANDLQQTSFSRD